MRIHMRAISLAISASLGLVSLCGISVPAFASGDDKSPAATSASSKNAAPVPDREKKVYTNDDIDRMWPKRKLSVVSSSGMPIQVAATPRAKSVTNQPLTPEKDPLWYAQQVAALEAEIGQIATREESLREFRASGSTDALPGMRVGLQLNAPCDGVTTDNEIFNLEQRRAEIEQQIAALEDTAQQNDMPPAIIRDAPEILAAAQNPLTPAEERTLLAERQAQLADELNATQNELAGMSEQATALGANLQPPTPGFGGNMTTDLIERLDNRADEIRGALDQTEDAARQAGAGER
jgi:prefoldin subunit 5